MQTRSQSSTILIILILVITFPIWFGVAALVIGLAAGLIGAVFGLLAGLTGATFALLALPFKMLFGGGFSTIVSNHAL
ncbi:MAG: hypothetical protein SH819_14795 [Cytophagales bacterium]|nr:hypothetical protein [Cytophagales bacterium]